MPIIDLQRDLYQLGRIRIGQVLTGKDGKARPSKLETFRLTSSHRQPLEAAADLYGGEVRAFKHDRSDHRWELFTASDELPVMIPPMESVSQWYEMWGGGGCVRRCDGQTAILLDGARGEFPCACNPEDRECDPHTRLSVILHEIQALGRWRLDSKGMNAARELVGAAELLSRATLLGRSVPATLRLEPRSQRFISPKGPMVHRFVVPVLTVDVTIEQARAIAAGDPMPPAELSAVQVALTSPAGQRARQAIGPAENPRRRSTRDAEAVIPPTGMAPPTLADSQAAEAARTAEPAKGSAPSIVRDLPEMVREDRELRQHIYWLAAESWGIGHDGLTGRARNRVVKWSKAIAEGQMEVHAFDERIELWQLHPEGDGPAATHVATVFNDLESSSTTTTEGTPE